jgi:hypothetical protein
MTYYIVRYRQGVSPEVIEEGLTLEQAQAHCQRGDTHGEGWFDAYREAGYRGARGNGLARALSTVYQS